MDGVDPAACPAAIDRRGRRIAASDMAQPRDDPEVEAVALADDVHRHAGPLASLDKGVGRLMTRESDDADVDGGLRMGQLTGDHQQVLRRAGDGARFHEREHPDGRCMTAGFELPFRAQAISSYRYANPWEGS